MARLSIFDLKKTVISKDLSGKYLLLYGKPKIGKTSFAAQIDKNLILAAEMGTNALDGLNVYPILKWTDVKAVLKELRDPRARELYNTITFDTITICGSLIESFICSREGVTQIKDIPFGQGFNMVAQELQETLREITLLGFGLVLICHSKEKASQYIDEDGNTLMSIEPDIGSKKITQVVNSVTDLIGYIGVEFDNEGKSQRYLYTRQTPTIFAGSRWRYLKGRIPFGYNELVDAIGDAIEKQKTLDGATVVEHQEQQFVVEARPFQEIMEEARNVWKDYIDGGTTDEEKDVRLNTMKNIIGKIFGNSEFKLSQSIPQQADLVELFIDEMKNL